MYFIHYIQDLCVGKQERQRAPELYPEVQGLPAQGPEPLDDLKGGDSLPDRRTGCQVSAYPPPAF